MHVVHEQRLLTRLRRPEQQRQTVCGLLRVLDIAVAVHQLAQLTPHLVDRVAGVDAGKIGDDRGGGRKRRRVRVRARAAFENHNLRAQAGKQLVGEAGLADAGLADHGDEDRPAGGGGQTETLPQHGPFARPTDKRDGAPGGSGGEACNGGTAEHLIETLGPDLSPGAVRNLAPGQGARGLADEDLSRSRRSLKPHRGVQHWSGDQQLAYRPDSYGRLPGLNPDSDLQRLGHARLLADPQGSAAQREARANGSQSVVLVHVGETENGHHSIADELLRPAAQRQELFVRRVEEPAQHIAGALGIEPLRESRRVDEVCEQDSDHLAFFRPQQGADDGSAVRAEASALR